MLHKEIIRTYECNECHKKVSGETTWDGKDMLPEKWISVGWRLAGPFADRKKHGDASAMTFNGDFCSKACAIKRISEILERELAD
jgi:hypothetical protein